MIPPRVVCETAEVAVECSRIAEQCGIPLAPEVHDSPLSVREESVAAWFVTTLPTPQELVALSEHDGVLCVIRPDFEVARGFARDLGLVCVSELRAGIAAVALSALDAKRPWKASVRQLSQADRVRLDRSRGSAQAGGKLERYDATLLGYRYGRAKLAPVGEPRDVREALDAFAESDVSNRPAMPDYSSTDRRAVLDVIYGPPRALTDPASKRALAPYSLPLPIEELCSSASRAAAEAARIGFPVRIALASPDLRVWDHPELAADSIGNAARVRELYRQIMDMASEKAPDQDRLLGVTVAATRPTLAQLRVLVRPLREGLASAEISFADGHGVAADDRIMTALPLDVSRLEAALSRLRGSSLLLGGLAQVRKARLNALSGVLSQLAGFVNDFRDEVSAVEVAPLALVIGGEIEVREARVVVTDAFIRSLNADTA